MTSPGLEPFPRQHCQPSLPSLPVHPDLYEESPLLSLAWPPIYQRGKDSPLPFRNKPTSKHWSQDIQRLVEGSPWKQPVGKARIFPILPSQVCTSLTASCVQRNQVRCRCKKNPIPILDETSAYWGKWQLTRRWCSWTSSKRAFSYLLLKFSYTWG